MLQWHVSSLALPIISFFVSAKDVGSYLGIRALVKATNSRAASKAVRAGLPVGALRGLLKAGFTTDEIAYVTGTPASTLMRLLGERGRRLDVVTSDRVMRMARVAVLAQRYLGNRRRAMAWLRLPNAYLHNATPLEMIDTEDGTQTVAQSLVSIGYGSVA
jgi:putative toxin-antitoxin system antitoxin component (TIGR02293 family)